MTKAKTNRPKPPEDLDGEALLEWDRICGELDDSARLDKTDRAILVLYVETWATYRAAMQGVVKHGAVIRHPNKTTGTSPFYDVAKQTSAQLRRLLNDMGLTPASRKKGDAAPLDDLDF